MEEANPYISPVQATNPIIPTNFIHPIEFHLRTFNKLEPSTLPIIFCLPFHNELEILQYLLFSIRARGAILEHAHQLQNNSKDEVFLNHPLFTNEIVIPYTTSDRRFHNILTSQIAALSKQCTPTS